MRVEVLTRDVIEKVIEGDNDALNETYNYFLPIIEKNYELFSYIDSSTYKEIILDTIKEYLKKLNDYDVDFLNDYKKRIKKLTFNNIYPYIMNFNNHILTNYFNKLKTNKLENFCDFLKKINYKEDVDNSLIILELIPELEKEILKLIGDKKNVTPNMIKRLSSNHITKHFIGIYLLKNNISLDDEEILSYSDDESITDSLKQYYHEINQYKLLTPEEEIELFKRYQNNDKQSYNVLVNSNLKLVVSVARKYVGNGLDLQDLIQEGNIGLMTAINKFDYTKGCKFSTYAIYWIKQKITIAINNNGRTIRLPNGLVVKKLNIINQIREFNTLYGRDPTLDELSSLLNYSKERIEKIMNCSEVTSSLNVPIGEEGKKMN